MKHSSFPEEIQLIEVRKINAIISFSESISVNGEDESQNIEEGQVIWWGYKAKVIIRP